MQKLVFATNNQHKLSEIRAIFRDKVEILSLEDVGFYEDIPEDFQTLEENALFKAMTVYKRIHLPTFADDTGLEVDALGGSPGVYSARYAALDTSGHPNGNCSATDNIKKLLHELINIPSPRLAQFRTVIAFVADEYAEGRIFEGVVKGQITESWSGSEGFGYDPIFSPIGYDCTFAEMSSDEKNKISHRGLACMAFYKFFEENKK